MEKITYASALSFVITNCDMPSEVKEKLSALAESIAKRNSAKSDKPTKKQTENASVKAEIVSAMAELGKPSTISQIVKALGKEDITNQRVSALVRQLIADGVVVRTEEKRVAYFSLV